MVDGNNVVPSIRRETGKGNARRFPALQRVIENAPGVAHVVRLPSEVVDVSTGVLLALEFQCLRRVDVLRGEVQVELITQIAHRIWDGRLLYVVVAARVCRTAVDPEIGRPAAERR